MSSTQRHPSGEYYRRVSELQNNLEQADASPLLKTFQQDLEFRHLAGQLTGYVAGLTADGAVHSIQPVAASTPFLNSVGQPFSRFLTPASALAFRKALADLRESQSDCEFPVEGRQGETFLARLTRVKESGFGPQVICALEPVSQQECLRRNALRLEQFETAGLIGDQVIHDVNNSLTVLSGQLSLMQFRMQEAGLGDADQLSQKSTAALREIRSMLGKYQALLRNEPADLPTIKLEDLLRTTLESFPSERFHGPGTFSASIQADPFKLRLALGHVLQNALQFTPPGEQVSLSLRALDENECRNLPIPVPAGIHLEITDRGPGLSDEILNKAFRPFFSSRSDSEGLGLSIARAVIRRLNGSITLNSSPQGLTVRISLPCLRAEANSSVPPQPETGLNILLMDDEAHILEVAADMISTLGHTVFPAPDAEATLKCLAATRDAGGRIDVAILDLVMLNGPGGTETLRRLRALDPNIRAIACSGQVNNPAIRDPLSHGFNSILLKPFSIRDLMDALQEARSPEAAH